MIREEMADGWLQNPGFYIEMMMAKFASTRALVDDTSRGGSFSCERMEDGE